MPSSSSYKKYKKGFVKKHLEYFTRILMVVFGVPVAKQLYQIFILELIRTCKSKLELFATLRSK